MKVLLVANSDWNLWHYRLPLACALRDEGYEVVMVCPQGSYSTRLEAEGFRVVPWHLDRGSFGPLREARALASLVSIYRAERPGIVHHWTIKVNLYGGLAARALGIRHIHDWSGLGYVFSGGGKAGLLRKGLLPLLRAAHKDGWTSCQTVGDRRTLINMGVVNEERSIITNGSGVNTNVFYPVERRAWEPCTAVMGARLLYSKGVETLVEAAQILRSRNCPLRIVVAGAPDPGNPESVAPEHLEAWRSTRLVEFIGHVEDMASLLRTADIAVLPTYYPEGVPRFLLEAAASGLPLVASDIPGCRIAAIDNYNGFTVPAQDPWALASRLEVLCRDKELREEMGACSRLKAVGEFDERLVIEKYLGLYSQVAGKRSVAHARAVD